METTIEKGQKLKVVDKVTYLGSTNSIAVHTDDAITARTAKASVVFGRLCANVKERNGIKIEIQLKVYKSVVLPTHLYAYGTWTVCQRHAKILNLIFPLEKIETIVQNQMARQDPRHGGHAEGRDANMHTVLKLVQLRWTGLMRDFHRKLSREN